MVQTIEPELVAAEVARMVGEIGRVPADAELVAK
jgi:hypothetical protein